MGNKSISKIIPVVIMIGSIVYILSPVDAILDIIPIAGWLDDVGAGLIGVASFLKFLHSKKNKN